MFLRDLARRMRVAQFSSLHLPTESMEMLNMVRRNFGDPMYIELRVQGLPQVILVL
jgi:hypothetical protein